MSPNSEQQQMLEAKNIAGKEQYYSQDYLRCILGLKHLRCHWPQFISQFCTCSFFLLPKCLVAIRALNVNRFAPWLLWVSNWLPFPVSRNIHEFMISQLLPVEQFLEYGYSSSQENRVVLILSLTSYDSRNTSMLNTSFYLQVGLAVCNTQEEKFVWQSDKASDRMTEHASS